MAALLDLSNEPATLDIGDKSYVIKRLTIGDEVAVAQVLRRARMKDYLDLLNVTATTDEVVSNGLAQIANAKLSRYDILDDVQGEAAMIQRAVTLNGEAVKVLPSVDRRIITHMLLWMTNTPPKEGADTGPFPDGSTVKLSTPTETSESPGTKS